jgi:hypothetical protein
MTKKSNDSRFTPGARKLLAFQKAHPDLQGALAMWTVSRSACETVYPEAAEIFRREMAEFASDAQASC